MTSTSTIIVRVSGDDYQGDPQFNLYVDGTLVTTAQVTAVHGSGQWQDVTVTVPTAGLGPNQVSIEFSNDIYGGSSTADRNLYVDHIIVNGTQLSPSVATLTSPWNAPAVGTGNLYNQSTLVFNTSSILSAVIPPSAINDSATTRAADSVKISVLANDTDLKSNGTMSVKAIDTTGTLGSVILNADNTVTYTPGAAFAGLSSGETAQDIFHYSVTDPKGGVSTAAVTVTVKGVEKSPVAASDHATTDPTHAIQVNVLSNDHDANLHDVLTVKSINTTGTHGHVTLNTDGTISYDPTGAYASLAPGQSATDVFHYTISDGHGGTSSASASILVTAPKIATSTVTAGNDTAATDSAHPTTINVLGNDHDSNSAYKLTVTGLDTTGTHGNVTLNTDGTVTYNPGTAYSTLASGATAVDTFHYTVSDGHGGTSTAAVSVTVAGPAASGGGGTGGGTSHTPPPGSSAFFVSPNGNDSWSGTLAEPNAAGTDGPFASIGAAQHAMESSTVKTTYIRGGDYYLNHSIDLTKADSGESFLSYGNETPVIHGGQQLTGWSEGAGGIWTTHASTTLFQNGGTGNLIVNGTEEIHARFPDFAPSNPIQGGWLEATDSTGLANPNSSFHFNAGDLPHFANTSNLFVEVFGQRGWENYVLPVQSINYTTDTVTLSGSTWDAIGKGSRYFVFNASDQVNSAHEWYFNNTTGTVTLDSSDGHFTGTGAVAANLDHIFTTNGASNVTLGGLTLNGTTNTGSAVELDNSTNITLTGNHITNTGTGVNLVGTTNSHIEGGEISFTASNGVNLVSGSNGNVIQGNNIHDIGTEYLGSGIYFTGSSNNDFSHNQITNIAKFGIGGGSNQDDHSDASYNDIFEYNVINHANTSSSDGGGIMIIGRQQDLTNDIIRYNSVSNTTAAGTTSWDGTAGSTFLDPASKLVSFGIYLDDFASGIQVYGNLLNNNVGGIDVHSGWSNTISNNIVANGTGVALAMEEPNWSGPGAQASANNLYIDNIVYSPNNTGFGGEQGGSLTSASFQNNLYSNSQLFRVWGTSAPDYETFAQWQANGFDVGGKVADPMFVSPSTGNFTLATNSPAHAYGFIDLPTGQMGLTGYHAQGAWDFYGNV